MSTECDMGNTCFNETNKRKNVGPSMCKKDNRVLTKFKHEKWFGVS